MDAKFDEEPASAANLCFEAVLAFGLLAFAVTLDLGLIVDPRSVDVLASDASYSRLLISDASQLANAQTVAAFAGVLTPALIILVDACARRSRFSRSIRRIIGYGVGAALVVTACAAMRLSSGIPAPDFLARCGAPSNVSRVTDLTCTRPVPVSSLASFPSTNAALAMYATALCSLYLFCHVPSGESTFSVVLQAAPIIGGLATALAQVGSARAHASDAAWGIVVGLLVAVFVQSRFFGGLARSYHGEDATELAEFLHAHSAAANDELRQKQRTLALLSTATVPSTMPLPLRVLPAHYNVQETGKSAAAVSTPRNEAGPSSGAMPVSAMSSVERAKATIRALTAEGILKP